MLGRQFRQNALYTGTAGLARQAMAGSGFSAGELEELDVEPGLGNGGLGRLAACLLDSLAALDMPAVGYGIRYEFGIFKQAFDDGHQVELPDDWTFYGNPWEFPAPDDLQVIGFYGHTEAVEDDPGGLRARWVPAEIVRGRVGTGNFFLFGLTASSCSASPPPRPPPSGTTGTPRAPPAKATPSSRPPSTPSPPVPSPAPTTTPPSRSSPPSSTGTNTWSWPTTGPTSTATTRPSHPPGPTRTGGPGCRS